MRRLVMLAALSALVVAGCGRGQDPALGGGKAKGPVKTDLKVVAKNIAFSPTELDAPAGKALTITFENQDSTAHTFHLFAGTAGDVKTDAKSGPSTDTLHVTLNTPAVYNFQCDIHPSVMKGTIVVVKSSS